MRVRIVFRRCQLQFCECREQANNMVDCDIRFEQNPFGIYFAGQTLIGTVVLTLQKPKKVRGVSLGIHGSAECSWCEQAAPEHNQPTSEKYTGSEEYIKTTSYLIPRSRSDAEPNLILAGTHTYNFSCVLPQRLPTSFEGSKGYIRYTVRVALERPWKFDHTYRVAFTVLKQVDLNEIPALRIPSQGEVVKTFCCGPCKSKPLIMHASIPQCGYVPGQIVAVTVDVSNQSKVKVDEVKVILVKIIHYNSQTPYPKSMVEMAIVCEQRKTGLMSKSESHFQEDIQIPAIPPTIITISRVININYEIRVEARVPGVHINPVVKIPISIGTVPLRNYHQIGMPSVQAPVFVNSTVSGQERGFIPPANSMQPIEGPLRTDFDLPPPSYEESLGVSVNVNDNDEDLHPMGHTVYAPRYPVYNITPHAQMKPIEELPPSSSSTSDAAGRSMVIN